MKCDYYGKQFVCRKQATHRIFQDRREVGRMCPVHTQVALVELPDMTAERIKTRSSGKTTDREVETP